MELDLIALVVGGFIGLIAGFVMGTYVMFKKVVEPVQGLMVMAEKVINKVSGGAKGGGGGLMGLIGSFLQGGGLQMLTGGNIKMPPVE